MALIALVCGLWLAIGLWATLRASRHTRGARQIEVDALRSRALLEAGPAMPLLIHADGSLEAPQRLAHALGLALPPSRLEGLSGGEGALTEEDGETFASLVQASVATGGPFTMRARARSSARLLRIQGGPAPAGYPPRSVLAWFTDATEAEEQMGALRDDGVRLTSALDALSALVEAAPFPMWHRGPDL
ncbi:MAG TPA: histidine kinase, partial [Allosphingosinicella sp.]